MSSRFRVNARYLNGPISLERKGIPLTHPDLQFLKALVLLTGSSRGKLQLSSKELIESAMDRGVRIGSVRVSDSHMHTRWGRSRS